MKTPAGTASEPRTEDYELRTEERTANSEQRTELRTQNSELPLSTQDSALRTTPSPQSSVLSPYVARRFSVLKIAPTFFFADYGCHVRILEEIRILQAM